MAMRRESRRGMTLIEMCTVLVILGVLIGIAAPASIRSRNIARSRTCITNMRVIDCAKQEWAMELEKSSLETPLWSDLKPYIRGIERAEKCPEGDIPYMLTRADQKTICPNVVAFPTHVRH